MADRISDLPRNLQESILCFLPIQDAVRTSTLSKKWRHCWTTIPHLNFDDQFSILDKLSQSHDDRQVKAYKIVSVINKVLLLHNGPIHKFSLALTIYWDCDRQIIHEFISQWIPLFSRNGIKELILDEDDEWGEFTAHNFSSLDLTHLRFTRGLFPYTPAFGVFKSLIILELVVVTLDFGQSIFNCPVLEKLTLIYCKGLFPINFCAPNLKCLHQAYDEITLEYAIAGLENLKEYSGVMLKSTTTQNEASNVVKILGSLHKIEKFSTGHYFLEYLAAGGCPNRLSKPLPYLKTLNIYEICFTKLSEVSCLLCLIKSAPNLCKLHISRLAFFREEDLEDYCIEDSEDCTIGHLEIVTFSRFKGLKAEMELVKFLLGHSPLLKTMSIHRTPFMEKNMALKVEEEIMQYSRASSRAQIRDMKDNLYLDDFDWDIWVDD